MTSMHVVPRGDQVEHLVVDAGDCVCGPATRPEERVDGGLDWVVIHHSLDGREHTEEPA